MSKTVLLTGITGFIAKRIAYDLLHKGYTVRGTLRSMSRADEVRNAVGEEHLGRLSFVELDLGRDEGWDAAMEGVDVLMHTASPFPMVQPKDEMDIIGPAVEGTKRALTAAANAGVKRIILTSSMVAVMYFDNPEGRAIGPGDWSDVNSDMMNAYGKSKTLAEKEARALIEAHPDVSLTTVHPGLVVGTPMDRHYGTSLAVIERVLSAKDPMQPDLQFPMVDIDDVSALHILAMERDDTAGQRILAADSIMSFPEIAKILSSAYPDRKIKTSTAPKFLIRLLSLFDAEIRSILSQVGKRFVLDLSATKEGLGHEFVPAREALLKSARYIVDHQST